MCMSVFKTEQALTAVRIVCYPGHRADQGDRGEHQPPEEGHRRQGGPHEAGAHAAGHTHGAAQRGAVPRCGAVPPDRGGRGTGANAGPAAGPPGRHGGLAQGPDAQPAGPGGRHPGQVQHAVHRRGGVHGDEEEHQHPAVLAREVQGRVLLLWDSCGDLVVWEMLRNLVGVGGDWGGRGV